MSIRSVILKRKTDPASDYPLSSLLKLIGVIVAPAVFLASSGRTPDRISWYFLILVSPFFLLSLPVGIFRYARRPTDDPSISETDLCS
jgi:hypothetical protein